MRHGMDSPMLKGMYSYYIDSVTSTIKSERVVFNGYAKLLKRNFKNSCRKPECDFRWENRVDKHDDVQRKIIGILPF